MLNHAHINVQLFWHYKSPSFHTVIRIHLVSLSSRILVVFATSIRIFWRKIKLLTAFATKYLERCQVFYHFFFRFPNSNLVGN